FLVMCFRYWYGHVVELDSFPTRRSSDLASMYAWMWSGETRSVQKSSRTSASSVSSSPMSIDSFMVLRSGSRNACNPKLESIIVFDKAHESLSRNIRSRIEGEPLMKPDTDLSGRTAFVTGAGSGLGRAEALRLAELGADVVVNDLGEEATAVADEVRALGSGALAVETDISAWKTGHELVEAAVDTFGGLDIVVNNAGIVRDTMIFNLTEDKWDKVIDVHLKGHAALCHAAGVHFRAASKAVGGPV